MEFLKYPVKKGYDSLRQTARLFRYETKIKHAERSDAAYSLKMLTRPKGELEMIYLDNASSTRVRNSAVQAMMPYFQGAYASSSAIHSKARQALIGTEIARAQCASVIHAEPSEIIFTSGGSESNNTAVSSAVQTTGKHHIITTAVEHPSVMNPCLALEKQGIRVTVLPVDSYGMVKAEDVEKAITSDTALVSVMAANNEVGTIMPIEAIGEICRKHGVLFHTDAVQAYGHIPMDVRKMNIDMLSVSAHKLHGPKGSGLLFVRTGVSFHPLICGAGQEEGRRAGTLNVPGIVGFGKAAEVAEQYMEEHIQKVTALRQRLIERVLNENPGTILTGHPEQRLPGNASFCFPGFDGLSLQLKLDEEGIIVSAGASAPAAGKRKAPAVLTAMGIEENLATSALRFSLSEFTTEEEIETAADVLHRILSE